MYPIRIKNSILILIKNISEEIHGILIYLTEISCSYSPPRLLKTTTSEKQFACFWQPFSADTFLKYLKVFVKFFSP